MKRVLSAECWVLSRRTGPSTQHPGPSTQDPAPRTQHPGLSTQDSTPPMPILEVKDLNVHYGAIHALHGVNISVEAGQIVTLIGANGAGKSTTLRAISGMIRPSAGSITFDGRAITALPAHQIVQMGIAHAPEGRGIFANMSV